MNRKFKFMTVVVCLISIVLGIASCGVPEPGYDEGYEEGYAKGIEQGTTESYDDGYDAGYTVGFQDGINVQQSEELNDALNKCELPDGFVYVAETVPDAILEIRYYSTYNFVGERITGYESPVAILTSEAAESLKGVSEDLAQLRYRLKIYDAYRPQMAVDHFSRWAEKIDDTSMKEYFYPDVDKSVLFEQGYIAERSGHSRGSAVDLTLVDMATGKEIDMGGSFDYFGEISHADYTRTLTQEQIANRQILRDAMLRHGFKGINTEWWHFVLKEEPYPDTYFNFVVQ